MKDEDGVTENSLENARELIAAHGRPTEILTQYAGGPICDFKTRVTFGDGFEHAFNGFSWGYAGEGPHGFAQFLAMSGIDVPFGRIASMRREIAYEWVTGKVVG